MLFYFIKKQIRFPSYGCIINSVGEYSLILFLFIKKDMDLWYNVSDKTTLRKVDFHVYK